MFWQAKNFKRFLIQAAFCVSHNAYEELNKMVCLTYNSKPVISLEKLQEAEEADKDENV